MIAQLAAQPLINTGLTYDYQPAGGESADQRDHHGPGRDRARVRDGVPPGSRDRLGQQLPETGLPAPRSPAVPRLVSVPGACTHVALVGRCPTSPGRGRGAEGRRRDVPAGRSGARSTRRRPDAVHRGRHLHAAAAAGRRVLVRPAVSRPSPGHVLPQLRPAGPRRGSPPRRASSCAATAWFVTVDQALDVTPQPDARTTPQRPRRGCGRAAQGRAARHAADRADPRGRQLAARRPSTSCWSAAGSPGRPVAPAVLSLILVALVLLSRLLAAAMGLRRGELALASLRGYGRRQLWFLGMLEPLLILAARDARWASLLGYLASRVLARAVAGARAAGAVRARQRAGRRGGRARHRRGRRGRGARRGERAAQRPDRRRTTSRPRRAGRS